MAEKIADAALPDRCATHGSLIGNACAGLRRKAASGPMGRGVRGRGAPLGKPRMYRVQFLRKCAEIANFLLFAQDRDDSAPPRVSCREGTRMDLRRPPPRGSCSRPLRATRLDRGAFLRHFPARLIKALNWRAFAPISGP
jgi:hypothetical protein